MLAQLRSWIDGLLRRNRLEGEMTDEMQTHLEMRAEHWREQGLSPEEAARRARVEFGGTDRYREECREARGLWLVDELRSDTRFAFRQMRRAPVFTAVAVTTLALAIGVNTAVFSLVEAVMLKSLPVKQPQELRELQWTARRTGFASTYDGSSRENDAHERVAWSFAFPVFTHLRDHTTTFSDLFCFSGTTRVSVRAGGGAALANGQLVSGGFFRGLGAEAALGRTLLPEDDRPNASEAVAVLGYAFWQRDFGGDPAVVGRTVHVNTEPVTVVGVMPPGFLGVSPGEAVDLMLPTALHRMLGEPNDALENPGRWWLRVMGRLKPGIPSEEARVEAETLVRQAISGARPSQEYDLPRLTLNEGGRGIDTARWAFATSLRVMTAATGAILLVACANIAGLLLMRGAARQREITMRLALGAGRARLVRQLLTESTWLAAIGGGLGVLIAYALRQTLPHALRPGANPLELDMEPRVFLFAFSTLASLLTGFACGLVPALRATGVGASLVLTRAVTGSVEGARRLWGGRTLVAFQVALSLVLLVAGGLFVRTMVNLRTQAMGFQAERVLVFQMDATLSGYKDERLNDFYQQVLDRIATLPGVRAVSCSQYGIPSQGARSDGALAVGEDGTAVEDGTFVHQVAPRYFETMGIPFRQGRDIAWMDRAETPRVAVVNEAFARKFFKGVLPVGRLFRLGNEPIEVIGVVGDAKFEDLRATAPPTAYLPYRQNPQGAMTFAVKTAVDPTALVGSLRATLASLDRDVPVYAVRTQEEQIHLATRQASLFAHLVSSVAVLALLLACLGIYGTLAYSVARRTPEIGLRMALGADRAQVVQMVLRDSLTPVLAGVTVGLFAALAANRLLRSMLFGLEPSDPGTLAAAVMLLLSTALLAAWLPSHRASRVQPMAALRLD
jgi:predicted permease